MDYKILAVDDNPINLKLLKRALVNSNYEVVTANSGKEALEITRKVLPDLVLLDVIMEDMDGYEVCKILQEQPETSQVPIIFLSAKNEAEDKTRGLALGAVDYLTKPFDPAELNTRVSRQLEIRQNNIRLLRENQQMHQQLVQADKQIKQYLNNVHTDFVQDSKLFSCAAKVISNLPPQTSSFIPLLQNESQILFLILNGFNKDYSTLAVELLFEQFARGFCAARNNTIENKDDLERLTQELMQNFSPDIYPVKFSFALSWLRSDTHTLSFYGIGQKPPLILDKKANPARVKNHHLAVAGKYGKLIDAVEISMQPDSLICFYRDGMNDRSAESDKKMFTPAVKTKGIDPKAVLQEIEQNLQANDNDQLISVLLTR